MYYYYRVYFILYFNFFFSYIYDTELKTIGRIPQLKYSISMDVDITLH